MRRWGSPVAVLLLVVSGRLAAQHAGQFEVGAFGSYTHYDPAFGLAQKMGGGVRLGYLVGEMVGVEGDLLFQPDYSVSSGGTPTTLQPLIGSASLVVNALHADRYMVYVLGGYTVLDFGTRAPYHFTDNAGHAAAGIRLFFTDRIAVRLEGRAIYSPSTPAAAPPTATPTASPTASISVPARRPASMWTRRAAPWTATGTSSPTASTSAPEHRPA